MAFSPDCVGEIAEEMARQLESGQVLLLENLRFHAEEEANDPAFSKALASLAEVYVNDAFGSAHRAHASTEGITHYLKPAVAGLLMEKEITYLGKALESPEKPFVAIIGGSKISGKIDVIQNLLDKVDTLVIVGGMAYTFQRALGVKTGKIAGRRRQDRHGEGGARKGEGQGREAAAAGGQHSGRQVCRRCQDAGVGLLERFSCRLAGAGHRAEVDRGDRGSGCDGKDDCVERAGGGVRVSALCGGNKCDCQAVAANRSGDIDHRRRRFGERDQPGRRGGPDHAHLDRRRGILEFLEGKKLPGVEALTDK